MNLFKIIYPFFIFYIVNLVLGFIGKFDSWNSHYTIIFSVFFILRSFHCPVLTPYWVNLLVCLTLCYLKNLVFFFSGDWNVIVQINIQNGRILALLIVKRGLLVMKFLLINVFIWHNFLVLSWDVLIIYKELKVFIFQIRLIIHKQNGELLFIQLLLDLRETAVNI